jgi:HEAT repeat protein
VDQHGGRQATRSAAVQVAVQLQGIDVLLADLLSEDEPRAEAAVEALVAAGQPALAALHRLRTSADADSRWWAIRVLAALENPRIEWFRPSLEDPAPEVRAAAALAVAAHPDPGAIEPLVRLLSDEDNLAAVMAVNALIKMGSAAVPELLDAFDDSPRRGQIQILRALAELRDPRAIQLLLDAQGQDSAVMQYWAQEGLERLGLSMVYLKPE